MKRLVAALERIATALEQLVPALTQATREYHYTTAGDSWSDEEIVTAALQILAEGRESI